MSAPSLLQRAGRAAVDRLRTPAQRRAHALASRPPTRAVPLERLDEELAEAGRLFQVSEDQARAFLLGIRLAMPDGAPPDPFSDEYRAWTWDLYHQISGRAGYATANEASPFQMDQALRRPFPHTTGSTTVAGDELMARGLALRAVALSPPARVVELGPGWGNLTCDLALLGFQVTGVEVDAQFCELVRARCTVPENLTMVCADMLSFSSPEPFDAAVFYESFHHCADHLAMLRRLHDLVRPDGLVVLAAEPIDYMEHPWGPRTDGFSLWAMRTHGWLELGFDPDYVAEALVRTGWRSERRVAGPGAPTAHLHVLRPDPAWRR